MAFRVCTVGCGSLANQAHGPSLRRYADTHGEVELTACCDVDAARAAAYRETFGFRRAYADVREMLHVEHPDAVCLMAPVEKTCELSCIIMTLGYPLLMEKPPGLNRHECQAMIAAARKAGVPNQVSFNRRYTPLVLQLRNELRGRPPEAIQNVRYDFFRIDRRDADFATTAIHGIDTTRFLAGADYRHVRFTYQPFPDLGPGVANIFMACEFTSGATGHLNFCPVTGVLIERATVTLFDTTFFLNIPIWQAFDTPGRLTQVEKGVVVADSVGDDEPLFIASGFYGENESFLDDLRLGRSPVGDIASGLQAVEIADCIRQRRTDYQA